MIKIVNKKNLPEWIKVKVSNSQNLRVVKGIISSLSLNTVCQESNCPNIWTCFNNKTATFMILGKSCTRSCKFCTVRKGRPEPINEYEPENIAQAVSELKLEHVVITSVTRDDLYDGGAQHFFNVIKHIRKKCPTVSIEVLIPDFNGKESSLIKVIEAKPDIIGHNIETIHSLYSNIRPEADYYRSLNLLKRVRDKSAIYTKSGFMVGLGETFNDVLSLMQDLRDIDCDFLTIGQYLQPTAEHYKVISYIPPEVFESYKSFGYKIGFKNVQSAPLIRSSFNAVNALKHLDNKRDDK